MTNGPSPEISQVLDSMAGYARMPSTRSAPAWLVLDWWTKLRLLLTSASATAPELRERARKWLIAETHTNTHGLASFCEEARQIIIGVFGTVSQMDGAEPELEASATATRAETQVSIPVLESDLWILEHQILPRLHGLTYSAACNILTCLRAFADQGRASEPPTLVCIQCGYGSDRHWEGRCPSYGSQEGFFASSGDVFADLGIAAVSSPSRVERPTCKTCNGRGWVMWSEHRDLGNGLGAGGAGNKPCPDCQPPAEASVERRAEAPADYKESPMSHELEREIAAALNRVSAENASNTPDFILAQFLLGCLAAWNQGVQQRETWYGRNAAPSLAPGAAQPDRNTIKSAHCGCSWWMNTGMSRDRCHDHRDVPLACPIQLPIAQPDSRPTAGAAPSEPERREVKLGVIEFHSERINPGLIKRFYAVRDDLTAAGCIVDLWLMDIASVLREFGYEMKVFTNKPLPLRASASSPERPTAAQGETTEPEVAALLKRAGDWLGKEWDRSVETFNPSESHCEEAADIMRLLVFCVENEARAAQGGSVSPEVLEKLRHFVATTAFMIENDAHCRYCGVVPHRDGCIFADVRALLVPAAGTPANGHPQEPK